MQYEDDVGQKEFRKRKERLGMKGYVLLLLLIVVITVTFIGGVLIRENLPSLGILERPEKVQYVEPPKDGMSLN